MGGVGQATLPFPDDADGELHLRPMFAPLASRRDAFESDRQIREVGWALIYAAVRLGGGLHTKQRYLRAAGFDADDPVANHRFEFFKDQGVFVSRLSKKHQERYALSSHAQVARLLVSRLAGAGGVSEVLYALDRTVSEVAGGELDTAGAQEALRSFVAYFRTAADELSVAAATAPIEEVYAKQRGHGLKEIGTKAAALHREIFARFPDLEAAARGLVEEVQHYLDAVSEVAERIRDEGAQTRAWGLLSAEEYRSAAARATVEELADVTRHLLFDPPSATIDAGRVGEAAKSYAEQPLPPRRPTPPATVRDAPSAVERALAAAERRRQHLVRLAEDLLDGGDEADVTRHLKIGGYRAAARLSADLRELHFDDGLPYEVEIRDAVIVDTTSPNITYYQPTVLRRVPSAARGAEQVEGVREDA